MQKVAEVAPREHDFLLKTAEEINSGPFRDEIVEELDYIIKYAGSMFATMGQKGLGALRSIGGALKKPMGDTTLAMTGILAAGVAATLGGDLYDAAHRGLTKTRNFKAMMEANPDLRRENPAYIKAHFNTLHRFNPEYSKDPNVAGSYVRAQSQFPEGDLSSVHGLVTSRKAIKDARGMRLMPVPFRSPLTGEEKAQEQAQLSLTKGQVGKTEADLRIAQQHFQNQGLESTPRGQ